MSCHDPPRALRFVPRWLLAAGTARIAAHPCRNTSSSPRLTPNLPSGGNFEFSSPLACRGESWKTATATVTSPSAREVLLTFATGTTATKHTGWATPDCQFLDMDDGGLYIRGAHPINMPPHEWLRVATAWVMRSAEISFSDGTRHLTPGVPIAPHAGPHYVGQVRKPHLI